MLGINEHILDFSIIDEKDKFNLIWLDKSIYMETPDLPILEVTKPMFKEVFRISIIPNKINVINSFLLGYDCYGELPDGLYNLKYCLNPHDVIYKCVDYFKISTLLGKIDNLLLNLDTCDLSKVKDLKNKIIDLFILTESIKANVEKGNTQLAVEQYKLANKIIDKYNECK